MLDPIASNQAADLSRSEPVSVSAAPQGLSRDALLRRMVVVLFISGACSLLYQVAWFRLARLVFGASTASTSAVVAIFMGGLGLGAALFGRRIARVGNPLNLYASLEAGIALTAALTPLLMAGAQWIYISLGGASGLDGVGATALRLVLTIVVLGVPTTLMGGTLPVIAQALEVERDRGRGRVALLYGVNTLGAVSGAAIATFLAIELLGIRQTVWVAALLNLLLALIVRTLARRTGAAERPAVEPELDERTASHPGLPIPVILAVAAIVGFVFFLMELVWYRTLAPLLGGSSYTFGIILAIALLGIGTGGVAYSFVHRERRPTVNGLAVVLILEGFFLIVPYALGDHLAFFAALLRFLSATGFSGLVTAWSIVAAIVIGPAAVVAGYQFPLLVGLYGAGARRVGHHVGRVYAWNTWGSILGSLAGGFGLLPLLGAVRLWWCSAALLTIVGLALAIAGLRARRPGLIPAAALAVTTLVLCTAQGPTAFWRHSPIGAGRFTGLYKAPNDLKRVINESRRTLLREAEGIESNVALVNHSQLALFVNGKSDGSALNDAPTVIMGGLVGALLHPAPQRALVIGLGSGSTAGWFAGVESIDRVDVIELEPAVIDFLPAFAPVNLDAHLSPKLRTSSGDGREYVLTSDEIYDLIFSEPSNPYRAGVADLFSQDFYRGVDARLATGGIFLQWLQLYELDAEVVQTAFATLTSVFPSVETWLVNSADLLLVASREPLVHDAAALADKVQREPFRSAMRRTWGVEGLEGLYSGYLAGPQLASSLADTPTSKISTDDRPVIEFGFVRNLGSQADVRGDLLRTAEMLDAARPPLVGRALSWELIHELRETRALRSTYPPATLSFEGAAAIRSAARRAYAAARVPEALGLWLEQDGAPSSTLDLLLIAEGMAHAGDPRAEDHLQQLAAVAPVDAELLRARWLMQQQREDEAAASLLAGYRALRTYPWVDWGQVTRSFDLARQLSASSPENARAFFDALAEPFAVYLFQDDRRRLRLEAALRARDPARCAAAVEDFEPHVPWQEAFLRGRLACYQESGHRLAERAQSELETFLSNAHPRLIVPQVDSSNAEPFPEEAPGDPLPP